MILIRISINICTWDANTCIGILKEANQIRRLRFVLPLTKRKFNFQRNFHRESRMPFKMAIFKLQRVSLRRPRSHVRRTLIKKRHSAKREGEKNMEHLDWSILLQRRKTQRTRKCEEKMNGNTGMRLRWLGIEFSLNDHCDHCRLFIETWK